MKYTIEDVKNLLPNTVKIQINEQFWNVHYYDEETEVLYIYYRIDDMLLNAQKTPDEISELSQTKDTDVKLFCLQLQTPKLNTPEL